LERKTKTTNGGNLPTNTRHKEKTPKKGPRESPTWKQRLPQEEYRNETEKIKGEEKKDYESLRSKRKTKKVSNLSNSKRGGETVISAQQKKDGK